MSDLSRCVSGSNHWQHLEFITYLFGFGFSCACHSFRNLLLLPFFPPCTCGCNPSSHQPHKSKWRKRWSNGIDISAHPTLINSQLASLPLPCFHSASLQLHGKEGFPFPHLSIPSSVSFTPHRYILIHSCWVSERLAKVGCLLMYFAKLPSLRKQCTSPVDKHILQTTYLLARQEFLLSKLDILEVFVSCFVLFCDWVCRCSPGCPEIHLTCTHSDPPALASFKQLLHLLLSGFRINFLQLWCMVYKLALQLFISIPAPVFRSTLTLRKSKRLNNLS